MISILVVCLGNICRSPAWQACLQKIIDDNKKTEEYYVDSCGLRSSFCGQMPDIRTKKAAEKRGVILSHIAREFDLLDYTRFDYILAVTKEIKRDLSSMAPDDLSRKKIHLLTHFSKLYKDKDIEDPYYGGEDGFDRMIEVLFEIANTFFFYLENNRKLHF